MDEASTEIPRPTFFEDPALDWCWATITALSAEVMTLRERLDSLEAISVGRGDLSEGELDAYAPPPGEAAQRKVRRTGFIARVFHLLDREFDGVA